MLTISLISMTVTVTHVSVCQNPSRPFSNSVSNRVQLLSRSSGWEKGIATRTRTHSSFGEYFRYLEKLRSLGLLEEKAFATAWGNGLRMHLEARLAGLQV